MSDINNFMDLSGAFIEFIEDSNVVLDSNKEEGTGTLVVCEIVQEIEVVEPVVVGVENNPNQTVRHGTSRKRKRHPESWKRNVAKTERYQPKGFPKFPHCKHPSGKLRCNELSMQDIRRIHQTFYQEKTRQWQNNYIIQHVSTGSPKRKTGETKRNLTNHFYLPKKRGDTVENVPVCKASFLSILQIKKDRVLNICQKVTEDDALSPKDTRGGDRRTKVYEERKESVRQHIKKFVPLERHHSRGTKGDRVYLSSELSITKMWSMYCEENSTEKAVKYDYYRQIFCDDFNIGFGAPSVDTCSTCSSLESRIGAEQQSVEKENLKTQLKVHKMRSDVFYEKLKEDNEGEITLSYDCQKNLVLPKVPDQAAYYSRQLYLYNFSMCQGSSESAQNTETVTSFVWLEHEYTKGSNQIASAVHHKLAKIDFTGTKRLRLFSDGCGGQNKNKTMISMLSHWLLLEAPACVEEIQLWFPIVGHSFIPPDRVFGNIERQLRKVNVIENPSGYITYIEKFATVVRLREDECPVRDWKAYADGNVRNPGSWHFQFQKAKKIVFTLNKTKKTCLVRGEPFYNFEAGEGKSILKRGKNFNKHPGPVPVELGVAIKEAKLKDVRRLLELHFGENWPANDKLGFFSEIFQEQEAIRQNNPRSQEEEEEEPAEFELMDGIEDKVT